MGFSTPVKTDIGSQVWVSSEETFNSGTSGSTEVFASATCDLGTFHVENDSTTEVTLVVKGSSISDGSASVSLATLTVPAGSTADVSSSEFINSWNPFLWLEFSAMEPLDGPLSIFLAARGLAGDGGLVGVIDSTDREYTPVATTITSAGDTTLYTPSAGKRVRLHWIYAINDPVSTNSTKISLKIGTTTYYTVWAISKRQQFTGGVDEPLIINLASTGNVAVTAFVEEV